VNALDLFLSEKSLSYTAFAKALERVLVAIGEKRTSVSYEAVRRWAQPHEAPEFNRPNAACLRGIYVLTEGAIVPETFVRLPKLNRELVAKGRAILADVAEQHRRAANAARAKGSKFAGISRARRRAMRGAA